jgi:manganese transport protein
MVRPYASVDIASHPHPGVQIAARDAIHGRTRGLRAILPFLGPAFIASIAYVDPGNFATNISAGAQYGYALLWVIVLANLMAMLIQGLSAKLGIATGMNLAELCRARFPAPTCYALWITQEVTAMATDLAEFLGASIGINLLFGVPLLPAAVITGVSVLVVLGLQRNGFRGLEAFIGGCALLIALCYVLETLLSRPDWGQVFYHSVVPSLPGGDATLLAVGIVGATVMPHVIYVHSNLTSGRIVPATEEEAQRVFAFERIDVIVAMGLAGLVNMAMLFMAARVFNETGHPEVAGIESAYQTLVPLLGGFAAVVFAISLVTSGVASSHVATLAGAHDDPSCCGDWAGIGSNPDPGHQPGGIEFHTAASGAHAHHVYVRPHTDGLARESAVHDRAGERMRRGNRRAERRAAVPNVHRPAGLTYR